MKAIVLLVAAVVLVGVSWSANAQFNANCQGNRRTLVHLFEWRWADIADECVRFLGPKGYCGVQVSPPNEHRVVNEGSVTRPWWERYQPVSYKIATRSGDETAFKDMVKRCNDVGVRIYVDAVINHMASDSAGAGNNGTGGTPFNTATLDFPGVPYISNDFHQKGRDCKTASGGIESYQDADQIRNCRLVGLVDLNQSKGYVRQKIIAWLNKMIGWGVAGFRIDAAKHMLPSDLEVIVNGLDNLNTDWFVANSKPFIYQEVIDHGDEPIKSSEYFSNGRVTEFNYGLYLSEAFNGEKQLKYLKNFGPEYGYLMPADKALVFVDNHDNQRGHGSGKSVLNFFKPQQYKMAVSFMLAWPYGQARVMSSYRWERKLAEDGSDQNNWMGPPADERFNIKPVLIDGKGECADGWVCEHRWKPIAGMVEFRNVAGDEEVANWWDNGANQIAFSRGNRAFYAVNGGTQALSKTLQTGLKPGRYCDVISGERSKDMARCSGTTITVDSEGRALISLNEANPMVALHLESLLRDEPIIPETTTPATTPTTTTLPMPANFKRTVVFIEKQTNAGQDLFLRGGINRPACDAEPTLCWIPIKYTPYSTKHYEGYNAWAQGDMFLDWGGREPTQTETYNNKKADGSPMAWTTNSPQSDAYNELNTFGQHYWMFDVMMDCSVTTDDGWFELKGVLNGGWEGDISQDQQCKGNAGLSSPSFTSRNHVAKCGFKNVFTWNGNGCQIDQI